MQDLYFGLAILASVSLLVFLSAARLGRWVSRQVRPWLAIGVVLGMVAYSCILWQSPSLAWLLPFSNLVIVGSWFPIFMAALAGCVWSTPSEMGARRNVLVVVLGTAGLLAAGWPLLGEAPQCRSQSACDGFFVQTTEYTCTAASAATLLTMHDIPASEQEMAELCLTRKGTSWLGLYRGLKLKTAGTKWDVEIVRGSIDELRDASKRPAIIEVGLSDAAMIDATFREEFGWEPGRRHSVILCGYEPNVRAEIIDPMPMFGRETWDNDTFKLLWRGYAMRLIERR